MFVVLVIGVLMAIVPDRPPEFTLMELAPAVKVCAVLKLVSEAGTYAVPYRVGLVEYQKVIPVAEP